MEKSVFETLSSVNVNGHTETKKQSGAQLTYLSWCWAWAEVVKRYPDASYTIVENADGNHFFASRYGIEVRTTVTINGVTHPMWLPVMDGTNHAMKDEPYTYTVKGYNGNPIEKTVAAASMMDINKAIMRCLVKNLAMFGLGLYIYAGEDLPEATDADAEPEKKAEPSSDKAAAKLNVSPQRPIRTTTNVDETAAPKAPARGRSQLFKQAWASYLKLSSVQTLDVDGQKKFFVALLKKTVNQTDPHVVTAEEWGRVIAHIDQIGKGVA